jgi:L-asparaginase
LITVLFLISGQAYALPKIKIVATGGTIAGAQADVKEAGYKAGTFRVEDLINAVPQLKTLADLSGEQIVNIGSQDMNNEVWLKLSKRVNELLKQPDVDGIVITHGTDTLEETGYFLNLVVKSSKPVVLVGSMRPATSISAEGPMNLYNAVAVAANPDAKGRGVMAVLNDEIHYAREIQKQNSTQLDTFKSPNRGRAGLVNTGTVHFFSKPVPKHTTETEFAIEGADSLPRVEIFRHANVAVTSSTLRERQGEGHRSCWCRRASRSALHRRLQEAAENRGCPQFAYRKRCRRPQYGLNDDNCFIASMELNPRKTRPPDTLA